MSRSFGHSNSFFLEYTGAIVTGVPLTLSAWFKAISAVQDQTLISIANNANTTDRFTLRLDTTGHVRGAANGGVATSTTTFPANEWHHGAAVFAATNSRSAYLDGAGKATSVTSATPAGINTTDIGRCPFSTPQEFMNGQIAHAAAWNVALSDDEVALLALGVHPIQIQPGSLLAYWPLFGGSPEPDLWGAYDMSVTGATLADDPPVLLRTGRFDPLWAAALAAHAPYYYLLNRGRV